MGAIGHNGGPDLDWSEYGGFIVESRDSRSHPIIGYGQQVRPADPSLGSCHSVNEAWRDMLHECRYADGFIMNGGRKMELRRGEMVGAISYLAHRWNWTPKTVRVFLDKLERDGMIARFARCSDGNTTKLEKGNQSGNHAAIISPCNYDIFNKRSKQERQSEGQSDGNRGAIEGQSRGKKHNKETKEQEDSPQTPDGGSTTLNPELPDQPKPISGKAVARIAFAQWQEFARAHGLSVPKDTTFETFSASILSRMREHADEPTQRGMLAVWHLALCHVAKSKWLRGMSGDFKADLGMITRPKNFAKLISGGYQNGAAAIDSRWSMQFVPQSAEAARKAEDRSEFEANERIAAAQGWVIPNQGVTRE